MSLYIKQVRILEEVFKYIQVSAVVGEQNK